MLLVAASFHFFDLAFVPRIERCCLPYPPQRFRVPRISAYPAMLGQDIPEPMEFAVLA